VTSGSVFFVGREDVGNDLHFVEEAFREERTDWTVDEAAGQRLTLTWLGLALEVTTRDTAGRVSLFLVIDSQREEVLVGICLLLGDDRDQYGNVLTGDDHGARGLTCHLAGFDHVVIIAELEFFSDDIEHFLPSVSAFPTIAETHSCCHRAIKKRTALAFRQVPSLPAQALPPGAGHPRERDRKRRPMSSTSLRS